MDKILTCKHAELDTLLESIYESDDILDDIDITSPTIGDDLIISNTPKIIIEDLNISIREGTYCNLNEETGEYEPDWDLTLIYENTEDDPDLDDPNNFVYFEQDPPLTAIHNYLHYKNSY